MTVKKRLLTEGLNFSLPLKYFDFRDYLVNFELFYRNIHKLGISYNEDLDFVKTVRKMQPSLLIEAIITMYCNIFLKKSSLLYKVYVKIKIWLSKTMIRVIASNGICEERKRSLKQRKFTKISSIIIHLLDLINQQLILLPTN